MRHANNFDLLRLLAALQVIWVHGIAHLSLPGGPLAYVAPLFPGVAVFFVISGFLVTDSFYRSRSLGNFLTKRALRIYPALVVNLCILELAMFAAGGGIIKSAAGYLVYMVIYCATASASFARSLTGINPHIDGGLFADYPSGVLWTLTVELSFYALLPLVLWLINAGRYAGIVTLAALIAGSFYLATFLSPQFLESHRYLVGTVPGYFWIFGIGIAARLAWPWIDKIFEGKAYCWIPTYLLVSWALHLTGEPLWLDFNNQVNGLTAIRIVLMSGALLSFAYSWPTLSTPLNKNDLSYGLYLYHMLVIASLKALGLTGAAYLWLVVLGCSALLAAVSWFVVERPFLALKPAGLGAAGTAGGILPSATAAAIRERS